MLNTEIKKNVFPQSLLLALPVSKNITITTQYLVWCANTYIHYNNKKFCLSHMAPTGNSFRIRICRDCLKASNRFAL